MKVWKILENPEISCANDQVDVVDAASCLLSNSRIMMIGCEELSSKVDITTQLLDFQPEQKHEKTVLEQEFAPSKRKGFAFAGSKRGVIYLFGGVECLTGEKLSSFYQARLTGESDRVLRWELIEPAAEPTEQPVGSSSRPQSSSKRKSIKGKGGKGGKKTPEPSDDEGPAWPSPRAYATAGCCLLSGDLEGFVMFGGLGNGTESSPPEEEEEDITRNGNFLMPVLSDLWTFQGGLWRREYPDGEGPRNIMYMTCVPVMNGTKLIFHGGYNLRGSAYSAGVWVLDLAAGAGWAQVLPEEGGVSPPPNCWSRLAMMRWPVDQDSRYTGTEEDALWEEYVPDQVEGGEDPGDLAENEVLEESLIIFGGAVDGGIANPILWRMNRGGQFFVVSADAGTVPPARFGHVMTSCQEGTACLIFGGGSGDGNRLNDMHLLDLVAPEPEVEEEPAPEEETEKVKTFENGDKYTGMFDEDKRSGTGCCEYANGNVYTGEWLNDKRAGKGECKYANGDVYGGTWKDDARHGHGKMEYNSLKGKKLSEEDAEKVIVEYEGEWNRGAPRGNGSCKYADGSTLEGYFGENSLPEGEATLRLGSATVHGNWVSGCLTEGTLKDSRGGEYEGQFLNRKPHGIGAMYRRDGSIYEGEWRNGRENGHGRFQEGRRRFFYEGKWVGGQRSGRGRCEYANGSIYDGVWVKNLRSGQGQMKWKNGDRYDGSWVKDLREGWGRYEEASSKAVLEGQWKADAFMSAEDVDTVEIDTQPSIDFSVTSQIDTLTDVKISARRSFSSTPSYSPKK